MPKGPEGSGISKTGTAMGRYQARASATGKPTHSFYQSMNREDCECDEPADRCRAPAGPDPENNGERRKDKQNQEQDL